MSTLAKEVADELQNSGIKDIGIVSSYTLPSTGGIADKQNNILVTEVTTVPNEYGSNQFTQTDETIELNIYYTRGAS